MTTATHHRALAVLTAPLVLFLAVPVGALVLRALIGGGLWAALTSQVVLHALALSLTTTAVSLTLKIGRASCRERV